MLSESVTQEYIHYFHLYKILEQTKFQLYGVPDATVGEIKKREREQLLPLGGGIDEKGVWGNFLCGGNVLYFDSFVLYK